MSWRRTRIARSSSQGDIGFFNQVQTIEYSEADHLKRKRRLQASVSFQKPAQKGVGDLQQGDDESRPCIFTIGSPEGEGKTENSWSKKKQQPAEGFGVFLKACFLCKKKLPPDEKDVYMYQYHCLAAFCSPECREDQMALDGLDEEIAKDSPHIMFFGRPVKRFQPVKKLQRPREFYLGLNID